MNNLSQTLKKAPWVTPVFLLVICGLAYGLLLPTLGFFWDDWPYLLLYRRFGPGGYPDFVATDRPYSAWIFMLTTWLWGEQALGYHITGLLLYWLCAVLLWRLIRLIWPEYKKEALWVALLFAIYPGFLGHPKALIYNNHYAAMVLYMFSLVASVKAVSSGGKRAWLWHFPGVLAVMVSQFSLEYFIGWEAVRLIAIWLTVSKSIPEFAQRLWKSFLNIMPYGLATLFFLTWRVFFFQFPTYQPVSFTGESVSLARWLWDIASQSFEGVVLAWQRAIPGLINIDYSPRFWLTYYVLTGLVIGIVFVFLYFMGKDEETHRNAQFSPKPSFGLPALFMAIAGIGAAGWPFWLVNLTLNIDGFFTSRFTLAFIPWTALLITAGLHYLGRLRVNWSHILTSGVVAFLVGGSAGYHFQNANYYRHEWIEVQRYFQQLVTRAPDLEPGTILLVNDMRSIDIFQDDSLSAILILTYAPESRSEMLEYVLHYHSVRVNRQIPALEPGLPVNHVWRSMLFSSTTDKILVVHYDPPGCLHVVDPNQPDRIPADFPDWMALAVPLSKPNLIITDPETAATPPSHIFDLDEGPNWCLFYQAAELAAQRGDWGQVNHLADRAFDLSDRTNEPTERLVFIEGYLRTERWESARAVSDEMFDLLEGDSTEAICDLWQTVIDDDPGLASEINGGSWPSFCIVD